jgi:ribosomal protein L37AE/L43A
MRCNKCNSTNCLYNKEHGFWQCHDCQNVWAYAKDDPDYDEPEICVFCNGLGLNRESVLVKECTFCYGTGYKPVTK